jgi:AcrR family transcriptional regulator
VAQRSIGGDTRERILEVAEELISLHGMEGLRLKDVAERVGIRPPSIFAHFEGREAIGDAVAQRVLEQLAEVLERALGGESDPEKALRHGVRAIAGHLMEHPAHTRLMLRDLTRTRTGPELALWSPVVPVIVARIEDLLRRGEREGLFRRVDARAFFAQVQGAILGNIGWDGFREDGRAATPLSVRRIQDQAEDLALAYVALHGSD